MPTRGEDELLRWLRRRLGERSRLGDDAALLPAAGPRAVTVDSQIAGVHFVADLDPAIVARRLLAINLSDLAAVGALPACAFLALSAPVGFDHRRFLSAFVRACGDWQVDLTGGDLATSPERTVATLTLLGDLPPGGRWLERRGAAPGHDLWVGGALGESAAGRELVARGARITDGGRVRLPESLPKAPGLRRAARRSVRRHLLPEPQLDLGRALGSRPAGGGMDLSDGLAIDLRRLAHESRVGAVVEAEALPLAPGFRELCRLLDRDPLELALGGGEDYVLLFTLPAGEAPPEGFGCRRIGEITAGGGVRLRREGHTAPMPELGWDHLAPPDRPKTP